MTTMPPEMSAAATPTVTLPPTSVPRDPLSTLQSSRSRFMITDILAGSAAAAAAALQQNSANSPPNNNGGSHALTQTHAHTHQLHQHQQQQQQQQQHHAALQHYLTQQQHLMQQHQQQQQQFHSSPPPQSTHHQHHPHQQQQQQQQQHLHSHPHAGHPHHHPLSHLTPSALLNFPAGVAPNGLHAAQAAQAAQAAAAHYAALQQERERLRDLETTTGISANAAVTALDHDDRSRSPHPVGVGLGVGAGIGSGSGGGGMSAGVRDLSGNAQHHNGSSSVSGDQASTIDDSDSDTCGAKDDDGNSIKSDNLMGLSKKQRKARTAFTDHQLQTLEKSFERQKYLSVQDRMELANKLELSDCQVKTWYQNRRTKWKRQTAVGLELLAEAGNYAAFQRLYGGSPYLSAWPYAAAAAQTPHGAAPSPIDLYYRQAAAAVALQKPLSYRMYPSMPPMGGLGGMPVPPTSLSHLSASNSLSSLSNYYHTGAGGTHNSVPIHVLSPVRSDVSDKQRHSAELPTHTPSPPLNPGSPPERTEHNSSCPPASDEDVENDARGDRGAIADADEDDDEAAIEV